MPVGFTCICICLETGLDKKEGTKCLLDLLGIGLCTVIEIGKGKEQNACWILLGIGWCTVIEIGEIGSNC